MKTLTHNLKRNWFDMILSGIKREEYREIKEYYVRQYFDWKRSPYHILFFVEALKAGHEWPLFYLHPIDSIEFVNGMKPRNILPRFKCHVKSINIGTGRPEWGATPGKLYFVIALGNISDSKNINKPEVTNERQ